MTNFYTRIVPLLAAFVIMSCESTKEHETSNSERELQLKNSQETPVFHPSHEPAKQDAPFSDAVQVGNTFYLSGQIGMNQTTRTLVRGGIAPETTQTLENIKAVLAHHGLTMSDVVKAMVVLENIEDFAAFNAIYTQYFPQKPARTTFAASALAAGAKIEIEVIAIKSE